MLTLALTDQDVAATNDGKPGGPFLAAQVGSSHIASLFDLTLWSQPSIPLWHETLHVLWWQSFLGGLIVSLLAHGRIGTLMECKGTCRARLSFEV